MAATDHKSSLHVVMFPWLAFGHLIPYLDLAKILSARYGHRVSFVTTPRNAARLPHVPPSITIVSIPLPAVPGLPDAAEATTDISGDTQMDLLKQAFDGLEPGLTRFLSDSNPDWVITDFAPHWLPPVTARLGISTVFFFIMNACFLSFFGSVENQLDGLEYRTRPEDYMVPPRWVGFETQVAYRRYEANVIIRLGQVGESGISDLHRTAKVAMGADAIVMRHCHEFEPHWLTVLEQLHRQRVIPLGLMPQEIGDHDDDTWASIKGWLDGQDKGSVVYVAFGSEVVLSQDQFNELAHGLEISNESFFWVLRSPSASTAPVVLPSGFEERVQGRGIVWRSWAPQLKTLSHGSIGGFLTHCGWSSTIEGLMLGHPLITLPFLLDQGLNSRMIVQNGLGLEIPRNENDGSFTRDSLAESIKVVMVGEAGNKLRQRAREMSKMISDKELQGKYIDKFVEFLEDHVTKVKKGITQ